MKFAKFATFDLVAMQYSIYRKVLMKMGARIFIHIAAKCCEADTHHYIKGECLLMASGQNAR